MEKQTKDVLAFLKSTLEQEDILPESIPEIDLYMDQIITILTQNLSDHKRT